MKKKNVFIIFIVSTGLVILNGIFNSYINESFSYEERNKDRVVEVKSFWKKTNFNTHNQINIRSNDMNGMPILVASGFGKSYGEMIDNIISIEWGNNDSIIIKCVLRNGEKHTYKFQDYSN